MTALDRLSSGDTLFLDIESDVNAMYVAACLIFDASPLRTESGVLDFERILEFIQDRVSQHERYHQRITQTPLEHRPVWVGAPEIDIRHHVRRVQLVPATGDSGLKDLSAQFAAEPLDRARPLWSICVVDGIGHDRFAVLLKVHHCLADGVSSIQLAQTLLSSKPTNRATPGFPSTLPNSPRWHELLVAEICERIRMSRNLTKRLVESARKPLATAEKLVSGGIGLAHVLAAQLRPVAETPLDLSNTPARCLEWMQTDLSRISEIRARRGGTLNDVAVATVSLALGRLFEAQGISRRRQREMELRVAIPVDMRDEKDVTRLGNQISMIFAKVPVGEDDPLTVLDQTRESLAATKESNAATSLRSLLELAEWTPRFLTRRLTRWAMASHPANFVLTNVHGPRHSLYLLESRLLEVYPIVPLMPGQALAIAVLSYAGQLYWGFNADQGCFEDLRNWSREMAAAFEQIYSAATSH